MLQHNELYTSLSVFGSLIIKISVTCVWCDDKIIFIKRFKIFYFVYLIFKIIFNY